MLLDISQLKRLGILTVDGSEIARVHNYTIRRTDDGDELLIAIKIAPGEFVEIKSASNFQSAGIRAAL